MTEISLVAAIADNGVIGREGGLPWRLSTDLRRFKRETVGKPVVMGRRTWESFPRRPLPDRPNIVLTQRADFSPEGAEVRHSLAAALDLARDHARRLGAEEICVIGGGEVFRQAMPHADLLRITRVLATIAGDTFFPDINEGEWRAISSEDVPAGEKDSHATRYTVYRRRE